MIVTSVSAGHPVHRIRCAPITFDHLWLLMDLGNILLNISAAKSPLADLARWKLADFVLYIEELSECVFVVTRPAAVSRSLLQTSSAAFRAAVEDTVMIRFPLNLLFVFERRLIAAISAELIGLAIQPCKPQEAMTRE